MKGTDHVSFRLKEFLVAYLPRGVQGRGCRVRTRSVDECQRLKNRRGGRCLLSRFRVARVANHYGRLTSASASNTGRILVFALTGVESRLNKLTVASEDGAARRTEKGRR